MGLLRNYEANKQFTTREQVTLPTECTHIVDFAKEVEPPEDGILTRMLFNIPEDHGGNSGAALATPKSDPDR